jgi:hypothetical protein
MKRTIRRILFWTLFLLFIIVSPVAILYSQGYRFDNYKMIFIHSGSVTIKSVPSNPTISIDGKTRSSSNLDIINSSATVGGLRPGSYDLKITAEGYGDWKKNVEVHSGVSTEFWNVLLIPQNPSLKQIDSNDAKRFFPSPFGKKIAYDTNSQEGFSLFEADIKQNKSNSLFSASDIRLTDDNKKNIEWNFKEDALLCPIINKSGNDYLMISDAGDFDPQYLSAFSKLDSPRGARWSPKEKGIIYFLAKDPKKLETGLYSANINDKSIDLIIPSVSAYDLSGSSIFYLQNNNVLYKSDLKGNNISQITSNSLSDEILGDKARLIAYDDSRQVLITDSGDLFVHNDSLEDQIRKIADSVDDIQFSDDGKKLLYWNNNEISVMFLRNWDVQPYRIENEIQSIIRLSTPIKNVFWYKDYEHVFFATQNKIKIIELDPRDHRISSEILENNMDEFPATYDSGQGVYYFLRNNNDKNSIYYFELPIKTGFFG